MTVWNVGKTIDVVALTSTHLELELNECILTHHIGEALRRDDIDGPRHTATEHGILTILHTSHTHIRSFSTKA